MFGFGLGTLPMLLLMGGTVVKLGHLFRKQGLRTVAGILIMSFGFYAAYDALSSQEALYHSHQSLYSTGFWQRIT